MRKVFVGGVEIQFEDLREGMTFEVVDRPENDWEKFIWKSQSRRAVATSNPFRYEGNWSVHCRFE